MFYEPARGGIFIPAGLSPGDPRNGGHLPTDAAVNGVTDFRVRRIAGCR
jgi:hypothetical protein